MKENPSSPFCCHCWWSFKVIWTLCSVTPLAKMLSCLILNYPSGCHIFRWDVEGTSARFYFLGKPSQHSPFWDYGRHGASELCAWIFKSWAGLHVNWKIWASFWCRMKSCQNISGGSFISELIQAFNEFITALAESVVPGRRNYHSCPKYSYPVKPSSSQMMH